ncbi:MAG: heavy metal sensor histidine kinase [Acidobacteria bacterium]|nr:heavy metal sensor histidine kinase [Acidobacteriota bacterium]
MLRFPRRIARGLRFRLTLSYALFFTLLLAGVGILFREILSKRLDDGMREVLDQEWAAMKGYLHVSKGQPDWTWDTNDEDENAIVNRIRRFWMIADAQGKKIYASPSYEELGIDSPEYVRKIIQQSPEPGFRIAKDESGVPIQIRSGVVYADDRLHDAFFVAIGRSRYQTEQAIQEFTRIYLALMPVMIFGGCFLGWLLAGRALTPVREVARHAERITGSNLSLRIPGRQAGDELDYLIDTFNRMIERLESSFQQIRQFSTDVSHELRTPITAIRGQLEVALFNAKETEQYREAILNSLQDIERLSQIVRALLLLAQAESGQVALQRSRVDLASSLREIIDQFQIPAEEARVRLIEAVPAELAAEVDRVQIERMVSNLISNAVKFTPPGGEVRVTLRPLEGAFELVVADTGCGIAPEHLAHIFERFYRVPTSRPSPEKGLGLGLSFVAWIAKAHGGTVQVSSELDKGTRFTVSIPAPALPVEESAPAVKASAVPVDTTG